jgi:hypothetical protein
MLESNHRLRTGRHISLVTATKDLLPVGGPCIRDSAASQRTSWLLRMTIHPFQRARADATDYIRTAC